MSQFIKAGVIGHPIQQSKSPIIHNYWIKKYGLDGSYDKIDIAPDDLKVEVQKLVDAEYAGFNVTVPYKQAIMALCHEVDEMAREIGAVNTVKIIGKKLYGYNTDAFGFIENIKQAVPEFDFTKNSALVIGAGGAARAIVYGLLKQGVPEIIITNRTIEKSIDISALNKNRIHIIDWADREKALKNISLLVNTTSLGMTGQDELALDLTELSSHIVVNDIVYVPLQTDLLKNARLRGNVTITGIGMLLHQARPAFKRWFGVLPELDEALIKQVLS